MKPDDLKSWFQVGREVVGFIRDLVALSKEAREEKESRKKKDPCPTPSDSSQKKNS